MSGSGHDAGGSMRWLLTYADMITLLLAFFVIMYAVSKVDAKKYKTFASSVQTAFGKPHPMLREPIPGPIRPKPDQLTLLLDQLRDSVDAADLREGRITMERTPDAVVLRFQDRVFFERGKADLGPEARRLLGMVAATIADLPNAVEAEGHTDRLPIRAGRFASNWDLSLARATAVVRSLVQDHGLSPLRLSARGAGEFVPLVPNPPDGAEPRNRRVELKILAARGQAG